VLTSLLSQKQNYSNTAQEKEFDASILSFVVNNLRIHLEVLHQMKAI
jgi:uncharacterized protein YueI